MLELPVPPPIDLTSGLEAAWAANHPPGTVQASNTGGDRSDGALGESAVSAEPVSAEPAVASPESAFGSWAVPSEADRGLWLRVLPAAVRAAPASAGAEFVAKGEVGRMLEEQRSGTAGLTRTVVVLIGGLLALAAVVGTVVLPRLRRGAAPEA